MHFLLSGALLCVALLSACDGGGRTGSAANKSAPSASQGDVGQVSVDFLPGDADIPNPERGFYRWAWTSLEGLTAADMQDAFKHGYRLVYVPLRLDEYRTSALPPDLLERLHAGFAVARSAGVKILLRAVYNYPDNETEYKHAQDAKLPQVLAHIAQLKPVLHQNADVIAFVQAGFIGAWGEWHTSSNTLTGVESRTRIRDALLDALPPERFIQVRYPPFLIAWAPTLPGLNQGPQATDRVGVHNDCFLASSTDVGTYDSVASTRRTQQNHVAALGRFAPFGGETCNPADEPNPQPRTACKDILSEGARYHLNYLNDEYYREIFHERWLANGCMAEVKRSIGYRLQLKKVSHPTVASPAQSIRLELVVRNEGWARPFNPRALDIVLRNQSKGTVTRIAASGADPRHWHAGQDSEVILDLTLPGKLPAGTYDVMLALPDPAPSLRGDARYAIRPANADDPARCQQWDASIGAFMLGTQLSVR